MSQQRSDTADPARSDTVEVGQGPLDRPTLDDNDEPDTEDRTTRPSRQHSTSGSEIGSVIGRFHILDLLGAGGMGVVYAAYDPQLDRKVAIKVLRTRGLTPKRREREATRLLAEARAMAQLSHPNVVTVYEAGTIDERVFIAMEYVPGMTLREWRTDQKRSVAEILDAYIKAGRGLAAGHHARLIHRDFKPENVLVGLDGRVRVIDFGLARPSYTQVDTPTPGDEDLGVPAPTLLTTAGSLFGTPLYMAPEQHEKRDLDARSDQFAFCITLYEALYGCMPFPCTSYAELACAVIDGKIIPPEPNPEIPLRVVDAVLRGLRPNADERWPSMDALLDELEPPVGRRRGMIIAAAAITGAVAVGATLLIVRVTGDEPEVVNPCLAGEEQLAGVWDANVKGRVKSAFNATKRTHAPDTFQRVERALDRFSEDWVRRRREVCEATRLRHVQPEPDYDVRMQCMGARLGELKALVDLFATADARVVDKATLASRNLRMADSCTKLTATDAPAATTQLGGLENEWFAIRALAETKRYQEAVGRAQKLLERVQPLGNTSFEAEVKFLVGVMQSGAGRAADAETTLRETLIVAAHAKNDTLIAQVWSLLIFVIGNQQARHSEAIALQSVAQVAIERSDANRELLKYELLYNVGTAHYTKGEYRRAIDAHEASLALRTSLNRQNDEIDIALLLNSLAASYLRAGVVFKAKDMFTRALAMLEKELGPSHPDVAMVQVSFAGLDQAMLNYPDAVKHANDALRVLEEVHGPEHEAVASTIYSVAVSYNGLEDYKAAVPFYERAATIFQKANPNHAMYPLAVVGLADCLEEVNQAERAVVEGERGLAMVAEANNADKVQLAYARYVLAKALWSANRDRPRATALALEARKGFIAGGPAALNGTLAVDKWFEKIKGK